MVKKSRSRKKKWGTLAAINRARKLKKKQDMLQKKQEKKQGSSSPSPENIAQPMYFGCVFCGIRSTEPYLLASSHREHLKECPRWSLAPLPGTM